MLSVRRRTVLRRKAYRNAHLLSVVTAFILLVHFFRASLYESIDYALQVHPWSGQRQIEQSFSPTEKELICLHGAATSNGSGSNADGIPNVVHFMYIFKEPLAQKHGIQFDFINYLAVRSAIVSLRPDETYLHYAILSSSGNSVKPRLDPATNPWIRRLRNDIHLVEHKIENPYGQIPYLIEDLLRLHILRDNGGIFLDTDAFALKTFVNILHPPTPQDIVLGYEGGNRGGMGNAVMVARRNSTFINDWLDGYMHDSVRRGRKHNSVVFPQGLAARRPDALCVLSPGAFFWPTWTWRHVEWMHEELNETEADFWKGEIERHGGALFEDQLAYHAWSHVAWRRHLWKLSPEVVRRRDTRFNLLVRRFVEDDL
ncbi:glycosyl transferase [Metarhizium rileyi]|uniref:Glycosyl transferase n=1 Tax=Metarhizium rileyi (strain RCEF 4871) TaxID=1649241 RepID=A0A166Z7K0_METRR|nr:glycosyl transferase [Metarhizium rileyi RCEF 4871]TWU73876.1 hypothetical protein ED733_001803 [Metarhizium rileyi]